MDADAKLLAEIAIALKAKDKERLKVLQDTLKRYTWLREWRESGGKMIDWLEKPNPFVQFTD